MHLTPLVVKTMYIIRLLFTYHYHFHLNFHRHYQYSVDIYDFLRMLESVNDYDINPTIYITMHVV